MLLNCLKNLFPEVRAAEAALNMLTIFTPLILSVRVTPAVMK